jgi:hypothetical protein
MYIFESESGEELSMQVWIGLKKGGECVNGPERLLTRERLGQPLRKHSVTIAKAAVKGDDHHDR